jgi:hypothetical protein
LFTSTGDPVAMQMLRPSPLLAQAWLDDLFAAKAVGKAGIVRRAVRDVEREVGRAALVFEVRRRGFHLIECGGQFIVICNTGQLQIVC